MKKHKRLTGFQTCVLLFFFLPLPLLLLLQPPLVLPLLQNQLPPLRLLLLDLALCSLLLLFELFPFLLHNLLPSYFVVLGHPRQARLRLQIALVRKQVGVAPSLLDVLEGRLVILLLTFVV